MDEVRYKQVIVIRKDLNMRKGKMVAQGAHASLAAVLYVDDERIKNWFIDGRFAKICVSVNSEEELLAIHARAKESNLITSLIRDHGLTEFNGVLTYTAVAVGPDTEDKINEITGNLPLL